MIRDATAATPLSAARSAWMAACVGAMLALAPCPGAAHKSSDAYLSWRVDGERVEQRIDIALHDLDREIALDANDDGQLTWGEVRSRWPQIERLADDGVNVTADGTACTVERRAPAQLDQHTDGRYAVLQRSLRCAAKVNSLSVDYRLFATSDATHRGIARVVGNGESNRSEAGNVAMLIPGAGRVALALHVEGIDPASDGAAVTSGLSPGGASWLGFLVEGMRHIGAGLDHILFLVTLLMVAVWRREGTGWRPRESARSAWVETLRLVTAFTLAHSVTLSLAAAGVLAPPSRWVESVIAASVLVAAIDNIRPFIRGPRWVMVALFGLAHGFGFAGPLQDLGLQRGALAVPLLSFNLGVELGQIAVVALLLPVACALRHTTFYRAGVVPGGSALIAALSLLWLMERSLALSVWP